MEVDCTPSTTPGSSSNPRSNDLDALLVASLAAALFNTDESRGMTFCEPPSSAELGKWKIRDRTASPDTQDSADVWDDKFVEKLLQELNIIDDEV